MKKIIILFFLTHNLKTNNIDFKEAGKQIAEGFFEGGGEKLKNSKVAENLFSTLFKGFFAGMDKVLDSKEFTDFGKASGKAINTFTKNTNIGIQEAADELGKTMQQTFKHGSELDKGLNASVDVVTRNLNRGVGDLVHKNLMKVAAIGVGASSFYFTAQYSIPFGIRMIERAWTRPKLIIASSKKTLFEKFKGLFNQDTPIPMIFEEKLETRLDKLTKVTTTINNKIKEGKSNVKYRNLMLHGPPGTGKTLFASELAKRTGLEYVFMSGSSFYKFKEGEGIEALDELFAWANKSKGLMIFIDEAETFLSKRENMDPQSRAYQLLNNFLNYTGTRSNKFMLVFATNHKDVLDEAMYSRIDDLIEFSLPGKEERIRMLTLYKDKVLMDIKQNGELFVQSAKKVLSESAIEDIANKTEGFSGRELDGLINAIKTDSDILEPAVITKDIINTVVEQMVEKHKTFMNKSKK